MTVLLIKLGPINFCLNKEGEEDPQLN